MCTHQWVELHAFSQYIVPFLKQTSWRYTFKTRLLYTHKILKFTTIRLKIQIDQEQFRFNYLRAIFIRETEEYALDLRMSRHSRH